MKTDLISVIEAAYRVEQAEDAWLGGILDVASPLLDRGMGCSAFFYDARDVTALRIHGFLAAAANNDEAIMRAIERSSPERVAWVFRTQACRTASEGPDWQNQPAAKLFRTWGIADVLFVNGLDTSGIGCFLTAKLGDGIRIDNRTKRRLSRLATHLAAGYRLVRRLAPNDPDRADAVLTPSGKIVHAQGDAKEPGARGSLETATLAVEGARGSLRRRDPDAAVESWRGLVSARWSLVDRFERDGKRFVLAQENVAATDIRRELSGRERQAIAYARMGHTNKLIAYELGISASTVGVLLWRAAKKLGANSREELLRIADDEDTRG
ncbi:MAG: hypothetical protein JNL21_03990 [Myxococcales bacterium]|nr:hypothetical protein [Myxococcales bacterium]